MRLWKYHHQIIQKECGGTDTIQADKLPQTLPETCHASSSPGLKIFNLLAEITSALNPTIISFFIATRLRLTKRDFQSFQITRELRHHVLLYLLPRDLNPLLSSQVRRTASKHESSYFYRGHEPLRLLHGSVDSLEAGRVSPFSRRPSKVPDHAPLQISSRQVSTIRSVPPPPKKIPQKLHFGHQNGCASDRKESFFLFLTCQSGTECAKVCVCIRLQHYLCTVQILHFVE